jgi:hypothetical protein
MKDCALHLALPEHKEARICLDATNILTKSKSKIDHIKQMGNYFYSEDLAIVYCLILIK